MSNEGFKVQASIKDADGDMVNFRGDSNEELAAHLNGFDYGAYAQAKANLRGASKVGEIVQPSAPAAPPAFVQQPAAAPAPAPWNSGATAPAAAPQGGAACEFPGCGQPLVNKNTASGKPVLRCEAWRWNNGQANGHTSKFL